MKATKESKMSCIEKDDLLVACMTLLERCLRVFVCICTWWRECLRVFLYPVQFWLTHVCLLLWWLLLSVYLALVGLWIGLKVDTLILPLRKMCWGQKGMRERERERERRKRRRQEGGKIGEGRKNRKRCCILKCLFWCQSLQLRHINIYQFVQFLSGDLLYNTSILHFHLTTGLFMFFVLRTWQLLLFISMLMAYTSVYSICLWYYNVLCSTTQQMMCSLCFGEKKEAQLKYNVQVKKEENRREWN